MALRGYQQTIAVDTLYEVRKTGLGVEQISPTIETIGGTVNIYVSQTDPAGAAPVGMDIIANGAVFVGVADFAFIPNYLYIEELTPVTSVVLSGIEAV